jgi:4-hydroxythreonine-4-phosphate dehydrogenase
MSLPRIAVTAGEPAGIGPDLLVMVAQRPLEAELIAVGDAGVLQQRAAMLELPLRLHPFDVHHPTVAALPGTLKLLQVDTAVPVSASRLDPRNAQHVLSMLTAACDGCRDGQFDAMVTAPVQKSVINDAGFAFSGHTEFLADRCGMDLPVMMLATPGLRVALATTHLPLACVPGALSSALIERIIRILDAALRERFGLRQPRIRVCGLNPHAGEGGHLGREEIEVIAPAIRSCAATGIDVSGPWSADTVFNQGQRAATDCYLAMFHDQGLPVLKALGFGEAVNITLGLPIIRTSVDHGTALELAGSGHASVGSLLAAIDTAIGMVRGSMPRNNVR